MKNLLTIPTFGLVEYAKPTEDTDFSPSYSKMPMNVGVRRLMMRYGCEPGSPVGIPTQTAMAGTSRSQGVRQTTSDSSTQSRAISSRHVIVRDVAVRQQNDAGVISALDAYLVSTEHKKHRCHRAGTLGGVFWRCKSMIAHGDSGVKPQCSER